MRLIAGNATSTSSEASRGDLDVVAIAGVVQQGRVKAVEEPVVEHHLLAAAALLGGGAEEDDLAGECVATAAEPNRRETRCAIVLWPQPWPRPGRASYSARTRSAAGPPVPACQPAADAVAEAAHRPLHLEASARIASATQDAACLLEPWLGMGVDPVRRSRISAHAPPRIGGGRDLDDLRAGWRAGSPIGAVIGAPRGRPYAEREGSATMKSATTNSRMGELETLDDPQDDEDAPISATHAPRAPRCQSPHAVRDSAVTREGPRATTGARRGPLRPPIATAPT